MANHKNSEKLIEIEKTKSRKSEERFFAQFSETQLNAVLLLVLGVTFLGQGITRYLEIVNKEYLIRNWLILTIFSLLFLVFSVISITLSSASGPLKTKRRLNILSFLTFLIGAGFFFITLLFLLLVI